MRNIDQSEIESFKSKDLVTKIEMLKYFVSELSESVEQLEDSIVFKRRVVRSMRDFRVSSINIEKLFKLLRKETLKLDEEIRQENKLKKLKKREQSNNA